jgi:hypothetical protein
MVMQFLNMQSWIGIGVVPETTTGCICEDEEASFKATDSRRETESIARTSRWRKITENLTQFLLPANRAAPV